MRIYLGLATGALVLSAATIAAGGQKILEADLPPAVRQAIARETAGATVKSYTREVEHGTTMFEVETTVGGHARDLLFDATGTLVEVEEATGLEAVPVAVRAALEARGRVLSVETVTRGLTVTYEGRVHKNGRTSEVAVNAEGRSVKR